jgi:predicted dehydrogenase
MDDQKKPIGIAILGAGIFAREKHVPALKKLILEKYIFSLKAIYSRSKSSAEQLAALCREFAPGNYEITMLTNHN